jgi:ABC-type multidrug transport system fused ATPase/permease subunit
MFTSIKKILSLLSKREQKQLYGIFITILIMGIWEIVGISSIIPFLSVASNPEIIHTNKYLRWGFQLVGFTSINTFLVMLGLLTILVLVVSQTFSALTTYLIQNFTNMRLYSLSVRLFHKYLHQPYIYFLNHNSASLNKTILSEVQQVAKGVLISVTELVAKATVSLFIIGFLFVLEPLLATLVVAILGGAYVVIFMFVKNRLVTIGRGRLKANGLRFKVTAEAFGGIKHVKILGKEAVFVKEFRKPAMKFSHYTVYATLIGSLPNYAVSIIAFSGILLITIYLIAVKENFQQALPMIGLYAFAGYRLLPAIRSIYSEITQIRFNLPAVDILAGDLEGQHVDIDSIRMSNDIHPLPFKSELELKKITFSYPNTDVPIFNDLSLTIQANTSIGIVGPTGCGKTTIVDIILGLLQPQYGTLIVDGVAIHDCNLRNWQRNVGYVPQQIFLSDDSVARNIAFGVPNKEIDRNAVEKAARIANLHEFIMNELPDGYNTVIGERGVRLSGGQQQRIGIARALYHDPSFLIFDEATSSLDNITEVAVMEAISNLAGQKTMIMIAHRLTTVKTCDKIYMMEKGKIIAEADYDTLLKTSHEFQRMAKV